MKNTSRTPYIYKVTNLETHQYYIGSQCIGKTVGVNYFTSSTNKEFEEGFKTYKEEKYKIEIIKAFEDPDECVRVENYIIRNHMLLKDGLCLNRAYCCSGKKVFSTVGTHPSEETRKKLSEAHKGHPSGNKGIPSPYKGIPRSEEVKQKMSEALKGRPAWNKGVPLSEETKQKMSEALKGRPSWKRGLKGIPHSEETRKKMSEAHKIKISIEGEVFSSITEASKYYNVAKETIKYWVKTKKHNAVYIEKCPKI